jgi:hypothetical protein
MSIFAPPARPGLLASRRRLPLPHCPLPPRQRVTHLPPRPRRRNDHRRIGGVSTRRWDHSPAPPRSEQPQLRTVLSRSRADHPSMYEHPPPPTQAGSPSSAPGATPDRSRRTTIQRALAPNPSPRDMAHLPYIRSCALTGVAILDTMGLDTSCSHRVSHNGRSAWLTRHNQRNKNKAAGAPRSPGTRGAGSFLLTDSDRSFPVGTRRQGKWVRESVEARRQHGRW